MPTRDYETFVAEEGIQGGVEPSKGPSDGIELLLHSREQPFCAVWDMELLQCNPAFVALLGYQSEEEVLGRSFLDFVPEEEWPGFLERQRRRSQGVAVESRYHSRMLRSDGGVVWAELITQLGQFQGQPAVFCWLHDITEHRNTQDALAESLGMFQAILESTAEGVLVVDLNARIRAFNQRFAQMWSIPADLMECQDDRAVVAWVLDQIEDSEAFAARVEELYRQPEESSTDLVRLKDGRAIERYTQAQWYEGRPVGRVWSFRDITERLENERQLREIRQVLEESQATGGVCSWAADLRTGRAFWSHNAYTMYGLDAEKTEPGFEVFQAALHPDDRDRVLGLIHSALEKKQGHQAEYRIVRPDGSIRWITTSSRIERDAQGQAVRQVGLDVDITERKAAEQQLAHSISLLRSTIESSTDGIAVIDHRGFVEVFNRRFLELWGVDDEFMAIPDRELRTRRLSEKLRDPSAFLGLIESLDGEDYAETIDVLELKDGRVFERHSRPQLIDGKAAGRVWNIRDITSRRQNEEERRKLTAQLNQAQKMEAIGTLAGGIAHDFNNILFAIMGYAEMVMQSLPDSSSARQDQHEVLTAARRAAELVQHILTFSRQSVAEAVPVQVGMVVREVMRLLRATLPSNIIINTRIDDEKATVLADPMQLHQVLMNLCANAGHVMQEQGGLLEIGLRRFAVSPDGLEARRGLRPGPYLVLSVKDTGAGIPPDVIDRIFDPFFTTKEVGTGTGLGLSTVHGIVASLGGDITVYTELGRGTVFNVFLPSSDMQHSQAESSAQALPRGRENLLYVDDEATLARLGHDMLGRLGYQVHSYSDSTAAWEEFRRNPVFYDLVITDQTMPGLTGRDLARRVMKLRPGIPVILCTGFSHVMSEQMAQELGLADYLLKPISREDLARAVRKALDLNAGTY
ncbi:PAS domain S-box protein [bacterium]|nr:PAS domain S-box protein [bacterium]